MEVNLTIMLKGTRHKRVLESSEKNIGKSTIKLFFLRSSLFSNTQTYTHTHLCVFMCMKYDDCGHTLSIIDCTIPLQQELEMSHIFPLM